MPENITPKTTCAAAKRLRLRRRASASSRAKARARSAAVMSTAPTMRGTTYGPKGEAAVGWRTSIAGCSSAPSDTPALPTTPTTPIVAMMAA